MRQYLMAQVGIKTYEYCYVNFTKSDMGEKYTLVTINLPDDYNAQVNINWDIGLDMDNVRCFGYGQDSWGNPREIWFVPSKTLFDSHPFETFHNSIQITITLKSDGKYAERTIKTSKQIFLFDYSKY